MSIPFSLFMALKYLKPKRSFLSVVTVLSLLGVLLGVAVLVIVLSVMSGFDDMWRDKILSFNAHISIVGLNVIDEPYPIIDDINKVDGVIAAAPFIQGLVFVKSGNQIFTPFVRGVDTDREVLVSKVSEQMVAGKFDVNDNHVVVGQDLARKIGVNIGDQILVYSPYSFGSPDELRLPEELVVSGIFKVGMWDFDVGFILTSMSTSRDLCGLEHGVHGIQVMTDDPQLAPLVAHQIDEKLGLKYFVQTWMELNRQLFTALRVEKNMMFFLLIFITVVAAFGITNTLITVTVQKTKEIGLLKALGFSSRKVMSIFLWQGWIAGFIGTVMGIGFGLLVLRFRNNLMQLISNQLHYELLPKELYHLSEIPASTSVSDIALVAICVMLICTLAGIVPAYRAARLDPAKALRYE